MRVVWDKDKSSHEDLVKLAGLKDDKLEDRDFVRLEVSPKKVLCYFGMFIMSICFAIIFQGLDKTIIVNSSNTTIPYFKPLIDYLIYVVAYGITIYQLTIWSQELEGKK
jgi:hypothetical protein